MTVHKDFGMWGTCPPPKWGGTKGGNRFPMGGGDYCVFHIKIKSLIFDNELKLVIQEHNGAN